MGSNEVVLTCTYNIYFTQKYENSLKNSTENCHFYSLENRCILHRLVFVMICDMICICLLQRFMAGNR